MYLLEAASTYVSTEDEKNDFNKECKIFRDNSPRKN